MQIANRLGPLFDVCSRRLQAEGLSAGNLINCKEVVVFGSVAVGVDRPDSDLDLLIVGPRSFRFKSDRLDLISMTEAEVRKSRWLESELASHISGYGVWLSGTRQWGAVAVSEATQRQKRERIVAFLKRLPEAWHQLHHDYRLKYALKVRREMQRLLFLEDGVAVPATRLLDSVGKTDPVRDVVQERLLALITSPQKPFRRSFTALVRSQWMAPEDQPRVSS